MENKADRMEQVLENGTVSKTNKLYSYKKTFKILLSVSAFIFLFSPFPSLPFLARSGHSYISALFMVFTYSTDRHYVFLLCNGILVFLITSSSIFSTPFKDDHAHQSGPEFQPETKGYAVEEPKSEISVIPNTSGTLESLSKPSGLVEPQSRISVVIEDSGPSPQGEPKDTQMPRFPLLREDEKTEWFLVVQEDESVDCSGDAQSDDKPAAAAAAAEEEEEEEEEDEEEEEEQDEVGGEVAEEENAEQLHRRCEEFIRKMRERINNEACR